MRFKQFTDNQGYSLIELMVGLAIAGVVAAGVMGGYLTICDQAKEQRDISVMAMNQRGAMENIEVDFRLAGFDPGNLGLSGLFGVIDVRRYRVTDENTIPVPDSAGSPALTIIYDDNPLTRNIDADGVRDAFDNYFSYRLFDESNGEGRFSIARDRSPGSQDWTADTSCLTPRDVLADNIVAINFAYAIDVNNDGQLDTSPGGGIIWAIDSDNDNLLDFNLDANGNGVLDENDDAGWPNGDFVIDAADTVIGSGEMNGTANPLTDIAQVRIWILARAEVPTEGYNNTERYFMGDRILSAGNGDFNPQLKCSLLVRTIEGRNLP